MNQFSKNINSIMHTRYSYSNHRHKIKETRTLHHPKNTNNFS